MTKNVFFYLSCGFKVALKNFKNLANLVTYWIYLFSKILSIIFFPLIPAVVIAKYNIGKKDNEKINLLDSLNTTNSIKKYINVIFIITLLIFLILASILTIAFIFGSLTILGITNLRVLIILTIPLAIALLLFFIFAYCYLYPTFSLANSDFAATDCIKNSLKIMRNGGKIKALILSIISLLLKIIVVAIIFAVPAYFIFKVNGFGFDIVSTIVLFICTVIFIFVYPIISYSLLIAKVTFTSDLTSGFIENNDGIYSTEEVELINVLKNSHK